jgi:hypothetical protein
MRWHVIAMGGIGAACQGEAPYHGTKQPARTDTRRAFSSPAQSQR